MYTTVILVIAFIVGANTYKVWKNYSTSNPIPTAIVPLALLLFLLLMPVVLVGTLAFSLYKQIINIRLKLKYGKSYGGMLKGLDVVHTIDKVSNSKTCTLIVVEYNQQGSKCFFDAFAEFLFNLEKSVFKKVPKLHSKHFQYMGYMFMLKEDVYMKDCVRQMPLLESKGEELNHFELTRLIEKVHALDFPKDNTVYWDLQLGTQPISNKSSYKKHYPIILRNHHCASDGVALIKFLIGVIADQKKITKNSSLDGNDGSHILVQNLWDGFKKILLGFYVFTFAPSSAFTFLFLKGNDSNILHKQPLSGEPIFAFRVEEEDNYFKKVKKIKQHFPKTSFPEILLTAISESLYNYFKKKTLDVPEYLTISVPVVPGSSQLQNLIPGSVNLKDVSFQNNYSVVALKLPLFIKKQEAKLTQRLKLLQKEISILSNSVEYHLLYILMKFVFSELPISLIRFFFNAFDSTASVSIVPGTWDVTYGDGSFKVVDSGFWIPHIYKIGVGFSAYTYDKRLFVGISIDNTLIDNYEEAQSIVDDIFRNIDLFEKEIT